MLTFVLIFLCGYVVGSIPIAYLIVKRKSNLDIREEGSGNVGGFNAFYVTNSKLTGIAVGVLDGVKGLVAVYGAYLLQPESFWLHVLALFGAIIGHNYPVWLKFKGGRGLSTTAGGLFILGFSYTIVWCLLWTVGRLAKRDILPSNIIAIFLTPVILGLLPWEWVDKAIAVNVDMATFLLFTSLLSMVLLVGHVDVLKDLWKRSTREV